jgi:hypothetical protein
MTKTIYKVGDRVGVKSGHYRGYHGTVSRVAPGAISQLVWVSFDGWREVCYAPDDLKPAPVQS